tara:strand:- start:3022 stop:3240 length:219 start_codon:yes stop_codon:yes gene_type:complete
MISIDCIVCYQKTCEASPNGHVLHWLDENTDEDINWRFAFCKLCGWDMTKFVRLLKVLQQTKDMVTELDGRN